MNEVATDLYVGTVEDAGDEQLLAKHSVSSVVSLTFSGPEQGFPSSVDVVEQSMMDGPPHCRPPARRTAPSGACGRRSRC